MAEYRLLDFGDGRKLEAIGDRLLDRPCPAAAGVRKLQPQCWRQADSMVRQSGNKQSWQHRQPWANPINVDCGGFVMPVEPTPFGHIGLFPEQRPNWGWIQGFLREWQFSDKLRDESRPLRILNLFAYTGASTLAAATGWRGGGDMPDDAESPMVEVVHLDAAKPNVEAAKRAAAVNRLVGLPAKVKPVSSVSVSDAALAAAAADHRPPVSIRFIVDDARKFVSREIRRKRSYDLIILDPPAYGHGKKGTVWRLERDLWTLLSDCLKLLPNLGSEGTLSSPGRCGMLITGHTEGCGPREIRQWLKEQRAGVWNDDAGRAGLEDPAGRFLDAGFYMRVQWE